ANLDRVDAVTLKRSIETETGGTLFGPVQAKERHAVRPAQGYGGDKITGHACDGDCDQIAAYAVELPLIANVRPADLTADSSAIGEQIVLSGCTIVGISQG